MSRILQYHKDVLERISHADRTTFRKELRKAFRKLDNEEREALKQWFRTACLCRPPHAAAASGADQLK